MSITTFTPHRALWFAACALLAAAPLAAQPAPSSTRLELRPSDRIVLVGNTLAERQQYFNHFEALLLSLYPQLELSMRNMGWSADTITLQPRPLNFADTSTQLATHQADVLLLFFGTNESFEGEAGLPQFEKDLEAYLRKHLAAKYNGVEAPRVALVSPIAHERIERLVHVDVAARNRELGRYAEAMRRVAGKVGVPFADVFTPMQAAMAQAGAPLTINGMHLNAEGDKALAVALLNALGLAPEVLPATSKGYADLRALINEKNRLFFLRFRPLNAEYVVGRRVDPFGSVSFPPEMKRLDELVAQQEKKIWKQARSMKPPSPPRPAGAAVSLDQQGAQQ